MRRPCTTPEGAQRLLIRLQAMPPNHSIRDFDTRCLGHIDIACARGLPVYECCVARFRQTAASGEDGTGAADVRLLWVTKERSSKSRFTQLYLKVHDT
jgi:hypothetical protein